MGWGVGRSEVIQESGVRGVIEVIVKMQKKKKLNLLG